MAGLNEIERVAALEGLEKEVLKLTLRKERSTTEVLSRYVAGIQSLFADMYCSILRLSEGRMYNWVSPSLPDNYLKAIEGAPIGSNVGSCGAAAFHNKLVIVEDIQNDPKWDAFKDIAESSGLRACWSHPVTDSSGSVIATFAIYYGSVRKPSAEELKVIERSVSLLEIILENRKYAEELAQREMTLANLVERFTYVNQATNDAIYDYNISQNHVEWGPSFFRVFGFRQTTVFTIEMWAALVHPDDILPVRESLHHTLRQKDQNKWSAEYRLRNAAQQYIFVEEIGYLLRDQEGKAVRMIGLLRNISERKASEEALRRSNERYHDLFQLNPVPMFVYELESLRYLDVNDAAITHYGYTRQEFLNMTIKDIRPEEDLDILETIIREEVKPGMTHAAMVRHRKKNGELITVYNRGNSIDYNGREARIVVSIDHTDKLKAEEALKRSEHRFRTMIQDASDLVCVVSRDGIFKYASPSSERFLDGTGEGLIGKNIYSYVHPDDLRTLKAALGSLGSGSRIELQELRLVSHKAEVIWVETIITDRQEDPAIDGIILNSRDITQRMADSLRTRELLDRYNAVSRATSEAIWDSNIETGEITWNHALTQMFGYDNLLNSIDWWRAHVHPDDLEKVERIIYLAMTKKQSRWSCEYRFRHMEGYYKTVLDRGFILYNDQGAETRMIGSMQDITERMDYIHTIESHNKRLRDIAWTQSHMVRSPLANIMGLVPLIGDAAIDDQARDILLKDLMASAKQLDEVIKKIISSSSTEEF